MVHFGAICKHWGLHSSKELEIQVLDWHFLNCSGLGLIGWIVVIYRIFFFFVYVHGNTWRCCWTRFAAVGGISENRIDTTCSNSDGGNTTSLLYLHLLLSLKFFNSRRKETTLFVIKYNVTMFYNCQK